VQERDAPPAETADDVKWLYARDGGVVIEADYDLAVLCDNLKLKRRYIKQEEEAAEAMATMIKARMGHASTLMLGGKKLRHGKSKQGPCAHGLAGRLRRPARVRGEVRRI
jgi:hypothetical protein